MRGLKLRKRIIRIQKKKRYKYKIYKEYKKPFLITYIITITINFYMTVIIMKFEILYSIKIKIIKKDMKPGPFLQYEVWLERL